MSHPDGSLALAIAVRFAILFAAGSVVAALLAARRGRAVWKRMATILALIPVLLVPAYFGGFPFLALLALLGGMALWEWSRMLRAAGITTQGVVPLWVLGGGLLTAVAAFGLRGYLAGAVVIGLAASLVLALARAGGVERPHRTAAAPAGGLLLIGTMLASFVLIRGGIGGVETGGGGFGRLVFVLVTVHLADIGAYFGGQFFGRHALAPAISPAKTLEGLAAGLAAAAGAGLWFRDALGSGLSLAAVPLAVLLALAGLLGDLTASYFKRVARAKDYGRILPGHGGVLDRFDSYLLAAPVGWLLLSGFVAPAVILLCASGVLVLSMERRLEARG